MSAEGPELKIVTKTTNYVDNLGRNIQEHEIVYGEPEDDYARFIGFGVVNIQTPAGAIPRRIAFPIRDVENVQDAFQKFPEAFESEGRAAAEREVEALRRQLQDEESKIITPDALRRRGMGPGDNNGPVNGPTFGD